MDGILISVAALWAIAVMTPGPNFLLVTHAALRGSRISALWTVLGIALGTVLWGTAGFLGIGAMFAFAPWLYFGLKVVGGLYLMWLGVRLLVSAWRSANGTTQSAIPAISARRAVLRGLMTVAANPKSGAFVASLFAATLPANPTLELGAAMVLVMVVISAVWYSAVAWSLGHEGPRRLYVRSRKAIECLAGGLFILFGAKLLAGR